MQGEQADVVPLPAALKDPYGHALGSAVPPRQYAPSGHVWHAMPTPARYVPGAQTGFEGVADGVAPVERLAVVVGESDGELLAVLTNDGDLVRVLVKLVKFEAGMLELKGVLELKGWVLPPLQIRANGHGAHVPVVPAQYVLPTAVEA